MVNSFGGRCVKCGYGKNYAALDFHHRDPTSKTNAVGLLLLGSFEKAKKEAEKCDLLCANCHRETTYPDLGKTDC
jgi:hypothetical protein